MKKLIVSRSIFLGGAAAAFLGLALVLLPVVLAQNGQTGPTGDLSVVGEVSVNGVTARSGDIVLPGDTVQTIGPNSSALIKLGSRLGWVEVQGDTRIQLFYNVEELSIFVNQDAGIVRLHTGSRISATINRR